jgi:signal transduction histidine kinase
MIAESSDGLDRVAAIVRDVGGLSTHSRTQWEEADLNQLLDTAVRVAQPQLRMRAAVERRYAELPLVRCIPQELIQVFLNLMLNAAQAMDSPGTIRLVTEQSSNDACISVIDDGKGMTSNTAAQAFTPFFTTKAIGDGTGLGLSISRQIVEKHRGAIDVESAAGKGTIFRIRLPLSNPDDSTRTGAPAR